MIRQIYNLKHGIKNLIKWFPVIYNDRDWDQYFIYRLLENKFSHMEKFYLHDAHFVGSEKVAHTIMITKNLAKRLADDNYLMNATIDYDKIYGDEDLFTFEPSDNPDYHKLVHTGTKHQHDMFSRASKHSDQMEKQDKEMLFDLIKNNIDKFWD